MDYPGFFNSLLAANWFLPALGFVIAVALITLMIALPDVRETEAGEAEKTVALVK